MQIPSRRPPLTAQRSSDTAQRSSDRAQRSSDPASGHHQSPGSPPVPDRPVRARPAPAATPPVPPPPAGLMKAMSPGVVDYLFRQLVSGAPAEDLPWQKEGISLAEQPPGAELARRLAETDLEALTPVELFHYVRAAQRLAHWTEGLRKAAVERYCGFGGGAGADAPGLREEHRLSGSSGTPS